MDEDQSARRVAQKYLKVVDADYYEFESKFESKTKLCFLMWIKILLIAYHYAWFVVTVCLSNL